MLFRSVYIGRSYMDAPKVDGYVFVYSEGEHISGDFVQVEITGAKGYDLVGKIVADRDKRTNGGWL